MNSARVDRPVSVTAEWARYGKNPGDHEGYRVLACSGGPVSFRGFREAIVRYDLGTPDELPQVAISYLALNAQPDHGYLALAITEYKDSHKDATGRPIAYTRYFCAPYRDLAAEGTGYLALYQAFKGIELPWADGDPLLAQVPALPVLALSAGDLAVRVAALLLSDRNVCVVGAWQVSVAERLRFIDSVMSLLPYGMRAKMSAATWTRSTSQHRFRLFFSDSPRAALDGRESDLVAVWGRPDQTPVPAEFGYSQEYMNWLDSALRRPAGMLTDYREVTGFGSASVLRMLERLGVSVPSRRPQVTLPGPPQGPGEQSQNDHVTRLMLSISERASRGNVSGLKADVTTLRNLAKRQMDQSDRHLLESLRGWYRDVIFRNQLLRPQLQGQIGREAGSYDEALLTLAFGLPLSYPGYCQLEDLLGTGSAPDPPPAALLNTIRRTGLLHDPRLALIVLWHLGEKRPKEWSSLGGEGIRYLVNCLAAPWDQEHHARIVCQALVGYLANMPGKHKPAEVREALASHDYLAPVLQAWYGDKPQYQLEVLQTFLTAAFGAKLSEGPIIDVLQRGKHAPTWALLGAVLMMLDPADPDLADRAQKSFISGGLVKSGVGQGLDVRLLGCASPQVAPPRPGLPDPDATQPIDPRLAGPARRPLGALPPSMRGVTPAQHEPIFEPTSSQPPPPSQQQADEKRRGIFGGTKRT